MNQPIHTPNAPAAIGPYSQAIQAGNMVFVSGQIPVDPATGLATVPSGAGYDEFVHTGRINYVNEPSATQTVPNQPTDSGNQAAGNTHVVVKGDNLSKLAQTYLGNANQWRAIYEANKSIIKDPNLIYIGQVLTIPR